MKYFKQKQSHTEHGDRVMETETVSKNGQNPKSRTGRGIIFYAVISIFLASCSTAKIYTKPDAKDYAVKHRTLAILPPQVKIEQRKGSVENRQEQEKLETVNAQNEMYSRLLTFIQKGRMRLEIQEIEKTNAALQKIGYPYGDGANMTPEELAQALGVDALLRTDCVFSSQKYVGYGIAYAVIFFPYGTVWGVMMATMPTNSADANMKFYDGATGSLLYSYNNKFGGLNSKHIYLIDAAIKKAGKKSPYYRK